MAVLKLMPGADHPATKPTTLDEALAQAGYGFPSKQRALCREIHMSEDALRIWRTRGIRKVRLETEKLCERLAAKLRMDAYEVLVLIRKT